jgi:hypothetical protein
MHAEPIESQADLVGDVGRRPHESLILHASDISWTSSQNTPPEPLPAIGEPLRRGSARDPGTIPVGGGYSCEVQFPDAGFHWYHPQLRDDYAQEMGLYGTIVVEPSGPSYWPPVDRQLTFTLDDLLVEDGHIASFSRSGPNFTAMGRFGNVLLINSEPLPGQYRQHADLQLRRERRPGQTRRRRQRPVRAGDVRRRGPCSPPRNARS